MKKLFFATIMAFMALASMAQSNPSMRTVNASGMAEMEIIPDEIYVQVDLSEYDKKGQGKVGIDKIKTDFLRNMQSLGFTEKDISVQGQSGYNAQNWYQRKRKKDNPDMKATISYWVKVPDAKRVDQMVEKLDDEATQNFFIAKYTHSRIKEYRDQLRMQSLKNAREKAMMYAGALGEKLGAVHTINEPQEQGQYQPRPMYMAKAVMMEADNAAPALEVDYKKMKIQFECNVSFLLL